jgi:hypothetical protein
MQKKKIKIPIYFGDLIIIQVENSEEIEKIKKKYNIELPNSFNAFTFNIYKKRYTRYIMVFEENCNPRMIAHESLHVVRYIFEDRKMWFETNDNDEAQCYLLGWIVGECHKFLNIKKL